MRWLDAAFLFVLCGLLAGTSARAQSLGVMGDSLSDEYGEEPYGSYAENWNEQLANHAGIDLGPTAAAAGQPGGSWGEPRRTLHAYDWARSGASSSTLLSQGQHTGLASSVTNDGVQYAVLIIGANDFYPSSTAYQGIYTGSWSSTQIDAFLASVLTNITTALDAVLPTGVQLVIVNVPDYGVTPTVRSLLPDAVGRQRVADAISQLNIQIDAVAQFRGLPLIDLFGATVAMFGTHQVPNNILTIGNVAIHLDQSDTAGGTNPSAGFVHDGIHPNTTLQGVIANAISTALNMGYGAGFPVFTEAEILAHRGLAYGGSDTLVAQFGDYPDYIHNYAAAAVPVLSPTALLGLAAGLLGIGAGVGTRGLFGSRRSWGQIDAHPAESRASRRPLR